jgi:hypothetical protein
MTNRTHRAAVLGWMLAAILAPAQPLPDTYSVVATGEMGGPLSIKVNRNGSKELIEWRNESGDVHLRQLYDFQAHRVYNVDLVVNRCTIQEYASPFAPMNHDPIGGADEMRKEMAKDPPKVLRTEAVNGIKTRVADAVFPEGQGKMTFWLDEKYGFAVKQTITMRGKPERLLYEIRQISYAPSPASLFTPPAECTRVGGVTSATGGHAEAQVEVKVPTQTHDLGSAPAAARGKVTAVRLRLVPERYSGACPSPVQLVADITTDGPGTVWYEFLAGAVRKKGPAEGTVKFGSAGTQTVTLDAEYVRTPSVPRLSMIAAMEDENGKHGPQTVSSGSAYYNATCTTP